MLDLGYLPLALFQDSGTPTKLEIADTWVGMIQAVLTIVGLIAAGIIAVIKFHLLRPLSLRLEPEISGTVTRRGGTIYLHAVASAKNVGLTAIKIAPEYSGLRVSTFGADSGQWDWFGTYEVFEGVAEIPGNDSTREPLWIVIPERADCLALRLQLFIANSASLGWLSVSIVNLIPEEDNQGRGQPPVERGPLADLRERMERWLGSRA